MSIIFTVAGSLLAAFALAAAALCFSYPVSRGIIKPRRRTGRVLVFEVLFSLAFVSFQYHRQHQIPWPFVAIFGCIIGSAMFDWLLTSRRQRPAA